MRVQVVSFSGGRTSAYLASIMIEKFGREACRFVFMDTGAEHPATYDFIRKVDAHFGLDLVCLRCDASAPMGGGVSPSVVPISDIGPDLVPFRGICAKYGTPSVKTPSCTRDMKERICKKWCDSALGRQGWAMWLGIRADEPKRLRAVGSSPFCRFLAEIDDADKRDVLDFWAAQPFDLEIPEWLGNCVFCVKKSGLKLALAAREEPGIYAEWNAMIDSAPRGNKPEGFSNDDIYRSKMTLRQVVGMFSDASTDDLRSRIRSARKEPGTCSESCEPFTDPQLSLFG